MAGGVGRKAVVKAETLAELHRPHVFDGSTDSEWQMDHGYALGWQSHSYRGFRRTHHGGCVPGFNALAAFLPAKSLGICVLTNVTGSPLPRVVLNELCDRCLRLDPVGWERVTSHRIGDDGGLHRRAVPFCADKDAAHCPFFFGADDAGRCAPARVSE